jgi:hypothetical protein
MAAPSASVRVTRTVAGWRACVEVKVGVQYAARELVVESESSAEDVEAAVVQAIKDGGLLTLVDEKGSKLLVPVEKLAYVEIAHQETRSVGFGRI